MKGREYVLPSDRAVAGLLGGFIQDGVTFTHDQHKHLMRAYGYSESETEADIQIARDHHASDLFNSSVIPVSGDLKTKFQQSLVFMSRLESYYIPSLSGSILPDVYTT